MLIGASNGSDMLDYVLLGSNTQGVYATILTSKMVKLKIAEFGICVP